MGRRLGYALFLPFTNAHLKSSTEWSASTYAIGPHSYCHIAFRRIVRFLPRDATL